MSRILQLRRGGSAEHENFTGQIGEITMDTDAKSIRIHDGETPGGTPMARRDEIPDLTNVDYVVAWQMPTAENNNTWYRKYKSGWVEQGGIVSFNSLSDGSATSAIVQLPIQMNNTYYSVSCTATSAANFNRLYANCGEITTNSFCVGIRNIGGTTSASSVYWYVKG